VKYSSINNVTVLRGNFANTDAESESEYDAEL